MNPKRKQSKIPKRWKLTARNWHEQHTRIWKKENVLEKKKLITGEVRHQIKLTRERENYIRNKFVTKNRRVNRGEKTREHAKLDTPNDWNRQADSSTQTGRSIGRLADRLKDKYRCRLYKKKKLTHEQKNQKN